jgi:alkylation response protein AidB-like acyl-CoA dehydrogenase
MDFSLGTERELLANSLGRYLADKFDSEARLKALASPEGWSREVYDGLVQLGAIGALFTEETGGYGGSAFDIGVVFGEIGKGLAIGPFLGTLIAGKVLEAAGDTATIEQVVAGEKILTFAHEPAQGRDGRLAEPVRVEKSGGDFRLSGAKGVVSFAGEADLFVVTAESSSGVSTFLVSSDAPGLTVRSYPVVDGGQAGEVTLKDTPAALIGEEGQAADIVNHAVAAGLVALAWEGVAVMKVLRDRTIDYLRERKQFGIPIGKFQALQHRMGTIALEVEQAYSAAINAAVGFEEGGIAAQRAASSAKVTIGKSGSLVAEEAIQMHGGIGMTWEFAVSHYAKRLIMIGHELGDEDYHLQRFIELGQEAA